MIKIPLILSRISTYHLWYFNHSITYFYLIFCHKYIPKLFFYILFSLFQLLICDHFLPQLYSSFLRPTTHALYLVINIFPYFRYFLNYTFTHCSHHIFTHITRLFHWFHDNFFDHHFSPFCCSTLLFNWSFLPDSSTPLIVFSFKIYLISLVVEFGNYKIKHEKSLTNSSKQSPSKAHVGRQMIRRRCPPRGSYVLPLKIYNLD